MPRVTWPLLLDKPRIQIDVCFPDGTPAATRDLLADTGAGTAVSTFDLLLHEDDCQYCGGTPLPPITLEGAYAGTFPVFLVRVTGAALGFDAVVPVIGVSVVPLGFDGIAGLHFLNRFWYGNFASPDQFGLEF